MDMSVVSREMRRVFDRARLQQGEEDGNRNRQIVLRLVATRLMRNEADALDFCMTFTTFCVKKFYMVVFLRVSNWTGTSHDVRNNVLEGDRVVAATDTFTLRYDDGIERDIAVTRAVSVVRHHDVDSGLYSLRYICSCVLSQTSGLQCLHLTAVVLQYHTYSAAFKEVSECLHVRQLDISTHFDHYWQRNKSDFKNSPTFLTLGTHYSAGSDWNGCVGLRS